MDFEMNYELRDQTTIRESVEFVGIGVHSGIESRMIVHHAPQNNGIVFRRLDIDDNRKKIVKLSADTVVDPVMCTRVVNEFGISVCVIEHLIAALRISGITNVFIDIDHEEVPILDGSAKIFVESFTNAGTTRQNMKVPAIVIQKEISIDNGRGSRISILPPRHNDDHNIGLSINISLNYERINDVILGNNRCTFELDQNLRDEKLMDIARARTFGWFEDAQKIKSMGLARGASEKNTLIIMPDNSILNDEKLRSNDEIICHKALDLIGDISIIGYDIIGRIVGINTSHSQNNVLMNKLMNEIKEHTVIQKSYARNPDLNNIHRQQQDDSQIVNPRGIVMA